MKSILKLVALITIFQAFVLCAFGDEKPLGNPDATPFLVGIPMALAPLALTGNGLDLIHSSNLSDSAWGLEGTTFMINTLGMEILPKQIKPFVPGMLVWITFFYRLNQMEPTWTGKNNEIRVDASPATVNLAWRKWGCDLLGIAGSIVIEYVPLEYKF